MPLTPVTKKSIFQARYRPKLEYFDRVLATGSKLAEYKDWETDRLSVNLADKVNHCSAAIQHNCLTYEQDSGDLTLERNRIENLLGIVPSSLGVSEWIRLGFRRHCLLEVDCTFDEIMKILELKLLSQDDALLGVLDSRTKDLMYRVNLERGDLNIHLTIGPVKRDQLPRLLSFNVKEHLKQSEAAKKLREIQERYPETSVFFDVDVFRLGDSIPLIETKKFIDDARTTLESLVNGIAGYLLTHTVS